MSRHTSRKCPNCSDWIVPTNDNQNKHEDDIAKFVHLFGLQFSFVSNDFLGMETCVSLKAVKFDARSSERVMMIEDRKSKFDCWLLLWLSVVWLLVVWLCLRLSGCYRTVH